MRNDKDDDSHEFNRVNKAVRKAVRLLLKEGHRFDVEKFKRSPEVIYALDGAKLDDFELELLIIPLMDIRDWIWEEYAEKRLWTINESASLSVGIDPFIFDCESTQYNPGWRERRQLQYNKTQEAIILGELDATKKEETYYIKPTDFCVWALEADLLASNLTEPLRELAKQSIEQKAPEETKLTSKLLLERFVAYAEQRHYAEQISHSEERQRNLIAFAIYAKFDNPRSLKVRDIAKLAFNALSPKCQKLKGFNMSNLPKNLYDFDKKLASAAGRKEGEGFLSMIPSEQELMSTDPTHRWWNRWRPVIAKELPWLKLPE